VLQPQNMVSLYNGMALRPDAIPLYNDTMIVSAMLAARGGLAAGGRGARACES
jgi:hypothetical protein